VQQKLSLLTYYVFVPEQKSGGSFEPLETILCFPESSAKMAKWQMKKNVFVNGKVRRLIPMST
jgi:hypothetical protein